MPDHRRSRRARIGSQTLVAMMAGLALLVASGCNVIGVIAGKTVGQPPVLPQFEFDKTAPLLVLAENYRDPTSASIDADRVARMVGEDLQAHEVAPLITADELSAARDSRPAAFTKMSVVEVARAVGAKQVLYIDLTSVGVGSQQGSDVLKGVASANLRVIEADTGKIRFPDMASGYPVSYETPVRSARDGVSPDSVRGEALNELSVRIARLFYKYTPGDHEALGDQK